MTPARTVLVRLLAACILAFGLAPARPAPTAPANPQTPPVMVVAGPASPTLLAPPAMGRQQAAGGPLVEPEFPKDYELAQGHFYLQTSLEPGKGFAVTDDGGMTFWTFFDSHGGVDRFGFPVSERFEFKGFMTQAFQKSLLQWDPRTQTFNFFNTLDELGDAGFDEFLAVRRQTPSRQAFEGEAELPFEARVPLRLKLLEQDLDIKQVFFSNQDWFGQYGLPTGFAESELLTAIRTQRAVFQHWKVDGPWGPAGIVTIANAGDLAKETGFIPLEPSRPSPAPLPGKTARPAVIPADAAAQSRLEEARSAINQAYEIVWRHYATWRMGPITVVIYGDRDSFADANFNPEHNRSREFLRTVLGLHLRDPRGAASELRLNLQAIDSASDSASANLTDTVTHEFVHALQSEILGFATGSDWLIEGMAEAVSLRAGNSPLRQAQLAESFGAARRDGTLPPLARLATSDDWEDYGNQGPENRWLAQTAGYWAVSFLMDTFGDQVGFAILRKMRSDGISLDRALVSVTGMSVDQLDAAYRALTAVTARPPQPLALPLAA